MKTGIFILMMLLSANAHAKIISGDDCALEGEGNICHWEFDDVSKTLKISGTGSIGGYTPIGFEGSLPSIKERPWNGIAGQVEHVVVGEGITGIHDYTFQSFTKLKTAQIPQSLQLMTLGAFAWTSLSEINIPSSAYITAAALRDVNLKDVVLPDNVKLGDRAFMNTQLESITISDKVEILNENAFENNTSLRNIYCSGKMDVCKQKMAGVLKSLGLEDKVKWAYTPRRIYTVEEANNVTGKKNTVKLKYK